MLVTRDLEGNVIDEEVIIEDLDLRKSHARAEISGKNARDLAAARMGKSAPTETLDQLKRKNQIDYREL